MVIFLFSIDTLLCRVYHCLKNCIGETTNFILSLFWNDLAELCVCVCMCGYLFLYLMLILWAVNAKMSTILIFYSAQL